MAITTPLQESIAHWERMRDFTKTDQFNEEGPSSHHCALCQTYRANYCRGCSVSDFTRTTGCAKTPYQAAVKAYYIILVTRGPSRKTWKAWREAAQAEIDFLKSLLEDE